MIESAVNAIQSQLARSQDENLMSSKFVDPMLNASAFYSLYEIDKLLLNL